MKESSAAVTAPGWFAPEYLVPWLVGSPLTPASILTHVSGSHTSKSCATHARLYSAHSPWHDDSGLHGFPRHLAVVSGYGQSGTVLCTAGTAQVRIFVEKTTMRTKKGSSASHREDGTRGTQGENPLVDLPPSRHAAPPPFRSLCRVKPSVACQLASQTG